MLRWRDRFTSTPVEVALAVVGAGEVEVRIDDQQPFDRAKIHGAEGCLSVHCG